MSDITFWEAFWLGLAFGCGFYIAKAWAQMFDEVTKVVAGAMHEKRTAKHRETIP